MTMAPGMASGLAATRLGALQRQDWGTVASASLHSSRPSNCLASSSAQGPRTRLPATVPVTRPFREGIPSQLRRYPCAPARVLVTTTRLRSSSGEGPGVSSSSDEARWLREEQRWIREEQRWIREEQRWVREREQLLAQIQILREALASTLGAQAPAPAPPPPLLAREGSAIDVEVQLRALGLDTLPSPSAPSLPSSTGTSVSAAPPPPASPTPAPAPAPVPAPATANVPPAAAPARTAGAPKAPAGGSPRRTLRIGVEGNDVKEMHNALALEGFYCGEEDIEFEMFAECTDRAVKAWQSSIEVPEDGVMTPALLDRLLGDDAESYQGTPVASPSAPAPPKAATPPPVQEPPNPAPGAVGTPSTAVPTRDKPEIERFARSSIEAGERRVFLLGENRWEDPSRIHRVAAAKEASQEAPSGAAGVSSSGSVTSRAVNGVINVEVAAGQKGAGLKLALKQCFECRGIGRVTCLECEGTGELNVEEQFLDWAGDDAHCLYCDGIGAIDCDVCDGSGTEKEPAQ